MKKIYGFAALSAAMLLASCSNDNEPNVVVNEANQAAGYLAVSLVTPTGTRTLGDTQYGIEAENTISNVSFLLFDENNVVQQIATPTMGNSTDYKDNNHNVARAYDAVIVVQGKSFETLSTYKGILAVANTTLPADIEEGKTKLSDVLDIIDSYEGQTSGAFVMSNSVYRNDNNEDVVLTPIQGNIAPDADQAKAKAVDIYIERVLAKVNVNSIADINKKAVENQKYDGEQLYVWVDGIEVADQAPESYLVKNISGLTTPFTGWTNPASYRSYWSVTPTAWSEGKTYLNQTFDEIVANGAPATTGGNNFYTMENVPTQEGQRASSILVACHLSSSATEDKAVSLVRVPTDNSIVSQDNGKGVIIGLMNSSTNFGYVVGNTFYQFDPKDDADLFDFQGSASLDAHKAVLTLKEGHNRTLAKWDNATQTFSTTGSIKEELNNTLASEPYQVWYWNGGKCYYFLNIAAEEANDMVGVIRNHVYVLTMESIKGFGVPVADPEHRTIIPEIPTPDEPADWQLAAKVNVLQWAIVSQGVNFEIGEK